MIKQYTYKFGLYHNKEQAAFIAEQLGSCRFVYNFFLERAVNLYKVHGSAKADAEAMRLKQTAVTRKIIMFDAVKNVTEYSQHI